MSIGTAAPCAGWSVGKMLAVTTCEASLAERGSAVLGQDSYCAEAQPDTDGASAEDDN